MLRFHIVSLFPSFFASALQTGLMERALEKGLISVDFTDPRAFTRDRHRHVDDRPYGGGPGMVMQIDPVARALRSLPHPGRMLCMAPNGRPASQKLMRELALEEDITIVCGRYEGFDARLFRLFPLEPLAVGDIVLNGGETAALAILEAVSRLVPGFMGKEASGDEESFSAGLLEYPHFTRPPLYEGLAIPEILSEGNHADIARWRKEQALATTLARRPELLDEAELTEEDVRTLQGLGRTGLGRSISLCLLRQKEDRRARWERKIYASLDEAGLDACLDLARIFSLNAVLVADEQGHEGTAASLEQQMQVLPVRILQPVQQLPQFPGRENPGGLWPLEQQIGHLTGCPGSAANPAGVGGGNQIGLVPAQLFLHLGPDGLPLPLGGVESGDKPAE